MRKILDRQQMGPLQCNKSTDKAKPLPIVVHCTLMTA